MRRLLLVYSDISERCVTRDESCGKQELSQQNGAKIDGSESSTSMLQYLHVYRGGGEGGGAQCTHTHDNT